MIAPTLITSITKLNMRSLIALADLMQILSLFVFINLPYYP